MAQKAALKLSGGNSSVQSAGVELLSDIQEIFEIRQADRIHTKPLIDALCDDPEKSWATYNRGKPISPKQIAKRLAGYGIRSKTIRIGYDQAKGFEKSDFSEAFERYLSPSPYPENSRPTSQANNDAGFNGTDNEHGTVPEPSAVPLNSAIDVSWDAGTGKNREGHKRGIESQEQKFLPSLTLGEGHNAI